MDLKTFVIGIIYVSSLIETEAFPRKNHHLHERLEQRGLEDYVPRWFWSSKNADEDNAELPKFYVDQRNENANVIKNDTNGELSDDESTFGNHLVSEILGRVNSEHDLDTEKINPVRDIPEGVQPENVDEILERLKEDIRNTDAEEKAKTLNLWKSLTKTVSETTSPYLEVVFKNVRHVIDIGAFGTSKRSRCFTEMMNPLGGIMGMLLSLFGLMVGTARGNNASLSQFFGSQTPPTVLSAKNSNANAGAFSLPGLGRTNPGGVDVQWISLQDLAKRGGLQPNLGGGNQLINLSKLPGDSEVHPNQPNSTPDPNNILLMTLLLRLLGNGDGNGPSTNGVDTTRINLSALPKGLDISGIDLSKLPKGVDNAGLMTLIRKLINQPEIDKNDTNDNSRVVIVRTSDLDDSEKNPFEIFNIRGTPEERFKKISKKYENHPDMREKIIIVDELNRLKNYPKISSDLNDLIDALELKIRADDNYSDVLKIVKLNPNGKNKARKLRNVRFIDGTGNEFARSFNRDDDEKLWKELVESLTSNYDSKDINDPNTLKAFFKDLNLRSFED